MQSGREIALGFASCYFTACTTAVSALQPHQAQMHNHWVIAYRDDINSLCSLANSDEAVRPKQLYFIDSVYSPLPSQVQDSF